MRKVLVLTSLLALACCVYTIVSLQISVANTENIILQQQQQIKALRNRINFLQFKAVDPSLPVVYVITPTYPRPVQKAELTRLLNVFRIVPNLHWIIVEDFSSKTRVVENILNQFPQNSTHLNIATPKEMKIQPKEKWWKKPRGVFQRNLALSWLRDHAPSTKENAAVIYFADDDNTYTVELFEEIRYTKKVSVFPVGLVGGVLVEKPRVLDGKVKGWDVGWGPERKFAVDMAGFAVNLQHFMKHTGVQFLPKVKIGHQETEFLSQLITVADLEPLSVGRVLVWHTRTESPNLNREELFRKKFGKHSDANIQL